MSLLLIAGKTCAGKDSVCRELEKLGIERIVTCTTRPPREGEVDGVTYNYLTDREFEILEEQNYFFETTSYTLADGTVVKYGTPIKEENNNKCLIVNPDGIKAYQDIDCYTVYLYTNEEITWNRLRSRGTDSAEARRRIEADNKDFEHILDYCDVAIKNDGTIPIDKIADAIVYLYKMHE